MSDILLTPSALLAFLNEIEELKDKEITFHENADQVTVIIDGNEYILDASDSVEIEVDDQTADKVETANEYGYEEIGEDIEDIADEEVEGGIIKEIVKTLALGGLVRMTKHALEKA